MSSILKISCSVYGRGEKFCMVGMCLTGHGFQKYMLQKCSASIDSYPNHRVIWHKNVLIIVSKHVDVAGATSSFASTMRICGSSMMVIPSIILRRVPFGITSGRIHRVNTAK
jgi:hypothetical protein